MSDEKYLSQQIAEFALNLSYDQIPAEVIEHGKLLLLDTFGVASAAFDLEHAKMIREVAEEAGSRPECTLWGSEKKVQLADAVLYNASLIHGMDYDDTHVGGIVHPSAAVVSMAVTVGEQVGASGKAILEAAVAGWEVITRLALAAKGRFHDVGYHGTAIVSPFAAACVGAKLMGLSVDELMDALGICGSQAAGIQEFLHDGSWVKKIHPGWACHSAVYALKLARKGFKGPKQVFEGGFGLYQTHCGSTDGLKEAFSDLGEKWHTSEITFKMYPVCYFTHSFISCSLKLRKEFHIRSEQVRKIVCRADSRAYQIVCEPKDAKCRPTTDYMMRFSLPYLVAVSFVKGRISPWEIDLSLAHDPEILAMIDKIECVEDDSMANPGHFPGSVSVITVDGSRYEEEERIEPGAPENPVPEEAVREKFRNNADPALGKERIEKLSGVISRLEITDSMGELLECLDRESRTF